MRVERCPCSAEATQHTAAWRFARLLVTLCARERPVTPEVEAYLRDLADGREWSSHELAALPWENQGLTAFVEGHPEITDLGRVYLAARADERVVTRVWILDVDKRTRTARVEIPAWRSGVPVTVALDQLLSDLKEPVDELPRWVAAEAACGAEDADSVIPTRFRPHTDGVAPGAGRDDGTAVTRVGMPLNAGLVMTRFGDPPRLPASVALPVQVPAAVGGLLLDESDGPDGDVL